MHHGLWLRVCLYEAIIQSFHLPVICCLHGCSSFGLSLHVNGALGHGKFLLQALNLCSVFGCLCLSLLYGL